VLLVGQGGRGGATQMRGGGGRGATRLAIVAVAVAAAAVAAADKREAILWTISLFIV
jgi:hypothetical protein